MRGRMAGITVRGAIMGLMGKRTAKIVVADERPGMGLANALPLLFAAEEKA